jgi:DnaJ like chaperone protein
MSWFGKVVGGTFGFMMAGPIGAALGAALGHKLDRGEMQLGMLESGFEGTDPQRGQALFFDTLFSVMGHVAKADGRVSEAEIGAARAIMSRMRLNDQSRAAAIRLHLSGREAGFPLMARLEAFGRLAKPRSPVLRLFVELQVEAALADGQMDPRAEKMLLQICHRLDFSRFEFYGIRARLETERQFADFRSHSHRFYRQYQSPPGVMPNAPLREAYATLGLSPSATPDEIKRAYRKLISRHHPDKLSAQGVSSAHLRRATEQTQKIRKAYDVICKARNL